MKEDEEESVEIQGHPKRRCGRRRRRRRRMIIREEEEEGEQVDCEEEAEEEADTADVLDGVFEGGERPGDGGGLWALNGRRRIGSRLRRLLPVFPHRRVSSERLEVLRCRYHLVWINVYIYRSRISAPRI